MNFGMRMLFFAIAAFAAAAVSFDVRADGPPEYQALTVARFNSYDISNQPPRETVPGGYRSPTLGIQIHPSCFMYAARYGEYALSERKKTEARAEAWLQHSVEALFGGIDSCTVLYPEMKQYFQSWASQFRRTVVTCTQKTQLEVDFGAAFEFGPERVRGPRSLLVPEEVSGITVSKGQSMSREYKGVVTFPRDSFLAALNIHDDRASTKWSNVLIHEVFHATGANNRDDHNEVERRKPNPKNPCADDIGVDRVNLLTEVCGHDRKPLADSEAFDLLTKRMKACGPVKGCVNTFTSSFSGSALESYGLPRPAAVGVCETMAERMACADYVRTKAAASLGAAPKLKAVIGKVKARLEALLPHDSSEIPDELLKALGLQGTFDSLSATECFNAAFKKEPGEPYRFRMKWWAEIGYSPAERATFVSTTWSWVSLEKNAAQMMDASASKCGEPYKSQVQSLAATLQKSAQSLFLSDPHTLAASSFLDLPVDSDYFVNQPTAVRETFGFNSENAEAYKKVLGYDLYNEYFFELEKSSPGSLSLNCVTLGFHPKATINLAKDTLNVVMEPVKISCP